MSLPIHIVRDSNANKFEILYSFHPDRLLVEQSDNSWGGDFARGPRIISLVFVKFKAEEELRFPILVHWITPLGWIQVRMAYTRNGRNQMRLT